MDITEIADELQASRDDFHHLIDTATTAELRRPSDGTRWTNEQLLFHMLFGYLLVRNLLPLVRLMSHLPDRFSRGFAATLNAATRPFHVVNYVGSLGGARVLGPAGMERMMDRITASLVTSLGRRTPESLERGMHFPVGWDPYFRDHMTLAEVYHYATQHYEHHRRQLTIRGATDQRPGLG